MIVLQQSISNHDYPGRVHFSNLVEDSVIDVSVWVYAYLFIHWTNDLISCIAYSISFENPILKRATYHYQGVQFLEYRSSKQP